MMPRQPSSIDESRKVRQRAAGAFSASQSLWLSRRVRGPGNVSFMYDCCDRGGQKIGSGLATAKMKRL